MVRGVSTNVVAEEDLCAAFLIESEGVDSMSVADFVTSSTEIVEGVALVGCEEVDSDAENASIVVDGTSLFGVVPLSRGMLLVGVDLDAGTSGTGTVVVIVP